MWQEYTRETPARPFLAVIGSGLALLAAASLAWVITDARAVTGGGAVQSLPDWPIVFTLPRGYSWVKNTDDLYGDASPTGMRGSAAYMCKSPEHRDALLIVAFAVLPEGSTAEEAMLRLAGQEPQDEEPISVGPMPGAMTVVERGGGARAMVAAACSERGLAIAVGYAALDRDAGGRLLFREVCQSIKYKDWWVRPPQGEFFFPE
jgi:hypothetical protein